MAKRSRLAVEIQNAREGKELSQADLAKLAKVNQSTVSRLEAKGHKRCKSCDSARAVLEALGLSESLLRS